MCSIRSGCRQCPLAPRPPQCSRSIRKIAGYLRGPDRKAGIRGERAYDVGIHHPTITGAGSGGLAQMRFVATEGPAWLVGSRITYPACCADPLQNGHGAADVRYPDQHANEMAAQSASPDRRFLLRMP
jgi:hypothetical protein